MHAYITSEFLEVSKRNFITRESRLQSFFVYKSSFYLGKKFKIIVGGETTPLF